MRILDAELLVGVAAHGPAVSVHHPMVVSAKQDQIVQIGPTAEIPGHDVMDGGKGGVRAPWEPALAVPADHLSSLGPEGKRRDLLSARLTQGGPQIDTTTPTISSLTESPSSGDLDAGKTVTLTLNLSEAVTVAGGTPTLTLNDGGTATYTGGSGTSALTFSYTVAAGQNTSALAATAVNLNRRTITDGAGNAANLSLTGLTQSGPQIDTTTPTHLVAGQSRRRAAISMPARR